MNFLEGVGLTTIIIGGIYFLSEFLEKQKEYELKLALKKKENERLVVEWKEQQDRMARWKEEKKLKELERLEKQKDYSEKWKNINPEEEYLIRIGKIKSHIFDPEIYNRSPTIAPWGSNVERENGEKDQSKAKFLIKIDDILQNYRIPLEDLKLLYKGYSNEYYNDFCAFTEEDLSLETVGFKSILPDPIERAKSNLHQITLRKVVRTLEELKRIAEEKKHLPVFVTGRSAG